MRFKKLKLLILLAAAIFSPVSGAMAMDAWDDTPYPGHTYVMLNPYWPVFFISRIDFTNDQIEFAFEPTSLEGTGKELVRIGVYYVSDPNYEFDIRTITDFDHDFLTKIAENDRPLSYYYVRWSGYKHYLFDSEVELGLLKNYKLYYFAELSDGTYWADMADFASCREGWKYGFMCQGLGFHIDDNSKPYGWTKFTEKPAPQKYENPCLTGDLDCVKEVEVEVERECNCQCEKCEECPKCEECHDEPTPVQEPEPSTSEPEPTGELEDNTDETEPTSGEEELAEASDEPTEATDGPTEATDVPTNELHEPTEDDGSNENAFYLEQINAMLDAAYELNRETSDNVSKMMSFMNRNTGTNTVVVREVSTNIPESDLSDLEGHEGAGETTLNVPVLGKAEKTEVKEDEHALLFFIFGVIAGGTSPWFLLLIQKRRS